MCTSPVSPNSYDRLQGAFAEAQALYLHPEQSAVQELAAQLEASKMGVVAHFYMDPEARSTAWHVTCLEVLSQ